jgi:four helix bundle protein
MLNDKGGAMVKKRKDELLADRLLAFAVSVIKIVNDLPKDRVGKHVSYQLLKSGTSPGANYEEARGAESTRDFIHKLRVALKELKESRFWLKLIKAVPLIDPDRVVPLLQECEELIAILAKSIITARKSKSK